MKFKSILRSNHDLKKNGYKIFRKLHKLENRNGCCRAYSACFSDTYFFILSCRALVEIIQYEYPEAHSFGLKCDAFLEYLDYKAKRKGQLDKARIASFLNSYTLFFNQVITNKHKFVFDEKIKELWNVKCLMAYVATWGKDL